MRTMLRRWAQTGRYVQRRRTGERAAMKGGEMRGAALLFRRSAIVALGAE